MPKSVFALISVPLMLSLFACINKNNKPPEISTRPNTTTSGVTNTPDETQLKAELTGTWQPIDNKEDCACRCLNIQFDRIEENFCIESNQISVGTRYQLDMANKAVKLYFTDPGDLGVGGANLPWNKFDRTKPLAIIDITKLAEKRLAVKWLGFTEKDNTGKKYPYGEAYQTTYYKATTAANNNNAAGDSTDALLIANIQEEFSGCGCYFYRVDNLGKESEQPIFVSNVDGTDEAIMNVNGKDIKMKLVKRSEQKGEVKKGDRYVETYSNAKLYVNLDLIVTQICPPGDEECESTGYDVTITVTKDTHKEVIKAKGGCGC